MTKRTERGADVKAFYLLLVGALAFVEFRIFERPFRSTDLRHHPDPR